MKIDFYEMIEKAKNSGVKRMTIAFPHQESAVLSARKAKDDGMVEPILIGDADKIKKNAEDAGVDISDIEVIDIKDDEKASDKTVELVANGQADFLMKGLIDTSIILKAYLKPEYKMKTDKLMSHVALFNPGSYYKMLIVTDASMNIAPNLDQKRQIVQNAIDVAKKFGIEQPKVAAVAAIEKVNPKMIETVEARELQLMSEKGIIKDGIVAGPLALDNAIFEKAAKIKNIEHPVAGHADIIMLPNIQIGNILYKAFAFCANDKHAGVIVGGKKPIVLTSRSDDEHSKYNSIAFAKFLLEKGE